MDDATVESTESESSEAVSGSSGLLYPYMITSSSSPPKLPRRLRRRLVESERLKLNTTTTTTSSVQQIKAKLKQADLRRQQYHDLLSTKAQLLSSQVLAKPRSSTELLPLQDEHIGQRLAAEPNAAEQKRCWSEFVKLKKTTFALIKAYLDLNINVKSVKLMPFEQLALQIESPATIQTVKALLVQLETWITRKQAATDTSSLSSLQNIDHLIKSVAAPSQRDNTTNSTRSREVKKIRPRKEVAHGQDKLSRYPVRVVLCAYMILGHLDAICSGKGEYKIALTESAETFVREFELLIQIVLDGPVQTPQEESASAPTRLTFKSQLEAFDDAWCSYLYHFVTWKVKDASALDEELVRAACQLELSMMHTCNQTSEGDYGDLKPDMKAIRKQVTTDQQLLREIVQHSSGNAGVERIESALSDMRSRFLAAKEAGSSLASPSACMSSPNLPGSSFASISSSRGGNDLVDSNHRLGNIVHTLLKADNVAASSEVDSPSPEITTDGPLSSCAELVTENEMLVNEIVHEHRHGFAYGLDFSNEGQDSMKTKVRETVEKAFWDGVLESMKQDEADDSWVLKLTKEVQDELCELSPSSWRQEIVQSIDIDIISQVLKSGILDMDCLGRILEFALVTLQKLSAPANEDEMKTTHQKFLNKLGEISQDGDRENNSFGLLMVKGLRFVLRQIQTLKHEVSKARMRLLGPLIKGPNGVEYLKKAFASRYGSPADAPASLPLTVLWLSTVRIDSLREWDEYIESQSDLQMSTYSSPTILRTGGSIPLASKIGASTSISTGTEQPECKGERIDLLLRLGLLKLVSGVEGLTVETLPETLKLNLSRLRAVQSQLQKIIVIITSILVLQQALCGENLVTTSPKEMECVARTLFELLDTKEEDAGAAGIPEIVDMLGGFFLEGGGDSEKLQARKEVMGNMLAKSLRDGDAIFTRVSRCVYAAASEIVLGGSGVKGTELAERALRRVGAAAAALLTQKLVEVVEVLVVVATVSGSVHGAWYEQVVQNI